MKIKLSPAKLKGTVAAVSSKSDVHRLLIAAALSDGETVIRCNGICDDIEATADCLNALGAKIEISDGKITVRPIEKPAKKAELNCRDSGSTLRFLMPVAAALGTETKFVCSKQLQSRPILPLRRELESHEIEFTPPWQFPVEIKGKLESGKYQLHGNVSSQFITGLLFALPLLDGDSSLRLIPPVESRPYIDMTLGTLKEFGINIEENDNIFSIKGNQKYVTPKEVEAEGDWSNAAFFLTAGALGGDVTVTGLNFDSLQGDKAVIDRLSAMGACVEKSGDSVRVTGGELHGISFSAENIPDLVPVLSVAGASAKSGLTVVTKAERLRLKESNRLGAISECLNNIGCVNAETDDGLIIWSGEPLYGGEVFSFNDHRIIMSMAVAAGVATGDIVIRNAEAVTKSYPSFFEDYRALGGKADVIDD